MGNNYIMMADNNTQDSKMINESLQNAISSYKNCLKINPSDEEARHNLSKTLRRLEKQKNNQNNENTDSRNSANSKFDTIMGDLEMHRSELNKLREDISTLDGDFTTQTNRVKTIKIVHFIWGMAGLSILFLILNNIQRQ